MSASRTAAALCTPLAASCIERDEDTSLRNEVSFKPSGTGWALAEGGALLRSDDVGQSWRVEREPEPSFPATRPSISARTT